ncbi:MAG: hypothetical protein DRR19_18440 [Candidatus Parabeggiatoa sp. nov. 1]|nr:MAG: hypothetical protein DRR19_18440 [Gammaproteobacteria bacterium]
MFDAVDWDGFGFWFFSGHKFVVGASAPKFVVGALAPHVNTVSTTNYADKRINQNTFVVGALAPKLVVGALAPKFVVKDSEKKSLII